MLITKSVFTKENVERKFIAVGVRWLFFFSILHICLSLDTVLDRLKRLSNSELPSKFKVAIKDNTIRCLNTLKKNPLVIKEMFEFAKVHFLCWRQAVMGSGENLFRNFKNVC